MPLEGVRSIEKSNDFTENRTRHFPADSIEPQSTKLPCAPEEIMKVMEFAARHNCFGITETGQILFP
jgi:hypothetical protein